MFFRFRGLFRRHSPAIISRIVKRQHVAIFACCVASSSLLQAPMPALQAEKRFQESGYPRDISDPRKRLSPSVGRNKQAILEVLKAHLPSSQQRSSIRLLEVASGTGEHAAHFAAALPHAHWQPTEYTGCAGPHLSAHQELHDICASIVAHTEALPNVALPRELDASAAVWAAAGESVSGPPLLLWDAMLVCNVTHIAPPIVTEGILGAAARLLRPGGKLLIYGPFSQKDQSLSEGNVKFDGTLKGRGEGWGLRQAEWVEELAATRGLRLVDSVAMPANNLTLVFQQSSCAKL